MTGISAKFGDAECRASTTWLNCSVSCVILSFNFEAF